MHVAGYHATRAPKYALKVAWRAPVGALRLLGHAGRLVVWVGDTDLAKAKQPPWPLLKTGQTDVFTSQPFGTDQRGRWVPVTLMFTSGVIGAVPRMGKTFALRELALITALDPRPELHLYDLKGTGDLSALECVAHAYGVGDEDEQITAAVGELRALQAELRRRTRLIRELPRQLCPDNKITPELAARPDLGLHPVFVAVDECQIWFEHPEHGEHIEAIRTDLVKRGPAVGIVVYLDAPAAERVALRARAQREAAGTPRRARRGRHRRARRHPDTHAPAAANSRARASAAARSS